MGVGVCGPGGGWGGWPGGGWGGGQGGVAVAVGGRRAWWGGWPGGGGPGGMQAGRVGGGWYKRSYSQKGCLYGGVQNALRKRVG